ncbi:MobF family relaxase [Nocardioides daeguensis]|uniref:MobF family relaxase n=1 Tax=Nocardioides daeguensis TaxID=908359 RepID=A0ABP6VSM2_9ACTN|nr:MobF family relaxase [Nocardioides daeguensis]MBV6728571.1 relaxase domain-containing protein [Nocardioides daeguensis]MCR1773995.1 relaxase domain-containing protein [Nocardioides daeguensis]
MTVSMRVMSAGVGYQYLLRSVAAGDGNRHLSTPLTRYYSETGTPPGRWLGSGLHAFGHGDIRSGDPVTEHQLALLLGMGRDPVSGQPLGRAFPDLGGEPTDYGSDVAMSARRAVAGFDLTFSVPKSVSALWGVADAGTQALLVEAHHDAAAEVLDLLEREVAATRRGVSAGNGAVAQADVVGIAATAYDHWDSRLGDPQLHTHVVVSNKVRTVEDGRWRSLDGRPLHASVVALSEHYNALVADRLTRLFGIEWEERARGDGRSPSWELAPVPSELIHEFSSRSRGIELETDRLVAEYVAQFGKRPTSATVIRLRAQATLATRPEKRIRSLADLTGEWRGRARSILGTGAPEWARQITSGGGARPTPACLLRADDVPHDVVEDLAVAVIDKVGEKRSTWRHWNLWAEASRQTMGWRFASADDRETVIGQLVAEAKAQSLCLTPPELASVPKTFRRKDGSSRFRPRHSSVYSSRALLAAEDRLLALSRGRGAPTADAARMGLEVGPGKDHHLLSENQTKALASVAESGRRLDVLVGPAGAGKTTAMKALQTAWIAEHGRGSVVGLAPSAVAAQVLSEDLGIDCENTAKWLHEHDRGRAALSSGQLVIVDEATLAGTLALDRICGVAAEAGAKVLLVGDWAQLQSVDAGGAFSLLVNDRIDVPELAEVHRFVNGWERDASLDLRLGRSEVIDAYASHDRIREGTTEAMADEAYTAWRADIGAGRSSILVTEATRSVFELNKRARAERILDGDTAASTEVRLVDGSHASEGDIVITRRNDRRLKPLRGGWVRNGDRWQVMHVGKDGSADVRRISGSGHGTVTLPAAYVAEHVDLGYAVTAHRAQGITVDTSHVVVSGTTTRENLYVSMTRGRESNIAYVALDQPDESHSAPEPAEVTARTVLYGVLQHSGVELSAHQMIRAEQDQWGSIAQLAAEYETIAAVAQRDRWIELLDQSGLTRDQVDRVVGSDSFGPLTAELRRAESSHLDIATILPRVVARRGFGDAIDIGAVLISRLRHESRRTGRGKRTIEPQLIAGLIPVAGGAMEEEMALALRERARLIERRTQELVEAEVDSAGPWVAKVGPGPDEPAERARWLRELGAIAAYRARYGITSRRLLGEEPTTEAQRTDAARAEQAVRRARAVAREAGRSRRESRSTAPRWEAVIHRPGER